MTELFPMMTQKLPFRVITNENGLRELYRGLVPILIRNGPSNAVFFVLREEAQKLPQGVSHILNLLLESKLIQICILIQDTPLSRNVHQFVWGAVIGAFVSSIFYPLNVIKVVIQAKVGGPNENMFTVLRYIYNERGRSVKNVYKGLNMNCVRAFFSWGIMNAAYENLKEIIY